MINLQKLTKSNIEDILDLENRSWIPKVQASREIILERFEKKHVMLGIYSEKSELIGMLAFSYDYFNPQNKQEFPKTFIEFSTRISVSNPSAAFGYTICVKPDLRGMGLGSKLLKGLVNYLKDNHINYFVADGRCSSYNGSNKFDQEQVPYKPKFKNLVDKYLAGGAFPDQKEFLEDPTLALYYKRLDCIFWEIIPNFLPEDIPTGGNRVIFYRDINSG